MDTCVRRYDRLYSFGDFSDGAGGVNVVSTHRGEVHGEQLTDDDGGKGGKPFGSGVRKLDGNGGVLEKVRFVADDDGFGRSFPNAHHKIG